LLDVENNSVEVIYTSPYAIYNPSVSPDGKRIAYTVAPTEWDLTEISLPSGQLHAILTGGGVSWQPDWAPSGTHYLVSTNRYGTFDIVDISPADGFSRRLAQGSKDSGLAQPRWAPDGSRFLFVSQSHQTTKLMLSSAGGGRVTTLDSDADQSGAASWSPDGQWIAYIRVKEGKPQLAKIRPGSASGPVIFQGAPSPVASSDLRNSTQWSPAGDWILYETDGGLSVVSPGGKSSRRLTGRVFTIFGFSKDGSQVYGMYLNRAPNVQRELFSIKMQSGAEKLLAVLALPASVSAVSGFTMHPDGKRFATSIGKSLDDIWMLEGFDQSKTILQRLLRR
jgi:Tol biopolymer transport system component